MRETKRYNTAVGYVRVSTAEQSKNTSLEYQRERIEEFCCRNDIQLLQVFLDKASGKDLNRPDFAKAYKYLKEHKGGVDLFLCIKLDRLTRDTQTGLEAIKNIKALGVEVNYVDEWLEQTDSAQSRYMLTMRAAAAAFERETINERTSRGTEQAMKSGRYVKTPPMGYRMGRVGGKPCIVPDDKAPLIKELFESYVSGQHSQMELVKKFKVKGLNLSKSSISRILGNRLYTGHIDLQRYKIAPNNTVKGMHTPIISEELFERAQAIKTGRNRMVKKIRPKNADFPLSAFMVCPICGSPMYGSTSNNGKKRNVTREYQFYRCSKNCSGQAYKPELVHSALAEALSKVKPSENVVELFRRILVDQYQERMQAELEYVKNLKRAIKSYEESRSAMAEKFAMDKIEEEVYAQADKKLKGELTGLKAELSNYGERDKDLDQYVSFGLFLLSSLDAFYEKSPVNVKVKILGSYFVEKLVFENGKFRTMPFNEVIQLISKYNNDLEGTIKEPEALFSKNSRLVARRGLEPRTS